MAPADGNILETLGITPYQQAGEWAREELVRGEELLEGLAERVTVFLGIGLGEDARAVDVGLISPNGSSIRHRDRALSSAVNDE